MGLWVPVGFEEWQWQFSSVESTRPAAALGTSITPGNNTKGSYAQILSSANVAHDVWGLLINFNSNNVGAAARDTLVDIGVDEAGGTSYTVAIPDLLASCAGATATGGGGIYYYFPLAIKAGSSIAARASINNATVGTLRCHITLFGKPRYPGLTRRAAGVRAFGITAASSRGTTVTSGTTGEGTAALLASSIGSGNWWWQVGMGVNDTTMTNGGHYYADLLVGNGTVNQVVIRDQAFFVPSGNEALASAGTMIGCSYDAPSGLNVYGRLQCSGTADSALSLAGYAAYGYFS